MTYIRETATFIGVWVDGKLDHHQHVRITGIPGYVRNIEDDDRTYIIFEPTYLTEQGAELLVQRAIEGNPVSAKIDKGGVLSWRNL